MGKITVLIIEESDQELLDEIFKLTEKTKKRKNRRSDLIRFEGLEVREREKSVYLDGKEIRLSKIEYLILHHLVSHPMWVQSKHQIFEAVWPPVILPAAVPVLFPEKSPLYFCCLKA